MSIQEKIIISGKVFISDGRGYIPEPEKVVSETDPYYQADRPFLARKDDIPAVDKFALRAQYADVYYRKDVEYFNDYVKLKGASTKVYEAKKLTVRTGFGDKQVECNIVYEVYASGQSIQAYLFSPLTSKTSNWEFFILEYDLVDNIRTYPPDIKGRIGRNYMQDEDTGNYYHSQFCRRVYESVYSQLGGTGRKAFESLIVEGTDIAQDKTDEMAVKYEFNHIGRPYVNGAEWEEISSAPDIQTFAAHHGNYYTEDLGHGKRHENPELNRGRRYVFAKPLINTVAVSAGENQDGSGVWTSYGPDVRTFESYNRSEMNARYPEKNFLKDIAFGIITDNRTFTANSIHNGYTRYVEVGDRVVVDYYRQEGKEPVEAKVAEIVNGLTIRLDRDVTVYNNVLLNVEMRLGDVFGSIPQQSATCSIVAAKAAIVQDLTNANWQLVLEALDMTASNSTFEIVTGKKIYTTHKDERRGYGIYDVQRAVEYIFDNYINNVEYINSVISQLPKTNPLLSIKDLDGDNYVSKKMLEDVLRGYQEK